MTAQEVLALILINPVSQSVISSEVKGYASICILADAINLMAEWSGSDYRTNSLRLSRNNFKRKFIL